jgi:ribonuclease HII
MQAYLNENEIEAGIDEVARGCLAGPVYTAAVIWTNEIDPSDTNTILRDSKKLSKRKRLILRDYIKEYSLDYCVASSPAPIIDKKNILNATIDCMHEALNGLTIDMDHILVDGNRFKNYYRDNQPLPVPYTCVTKGDDKFISIAAASIMAKVEHDEYIEKLVEENPDLEKYDWLNNMCYGTKAHLEAINKYGVTEFHRKSFAPCSK